MQASRFITGKTWQRKRDTGPRGRQKMSVSNMVRMLQTQDTGLGSGADLLYTGAV